MRNYCIINGKNSRLIRGLLIQELPPIVKPEIRTEVTEIDGRDGDIVSTLGYSAYDKTMKIGLYGDYDIDEVISFFDTSGTVVFSNEIEKYYNFAIYQQIDFERLARFREAEVTFHVQPFKYSTTETTARLNSQIMHPIVGDYSTGGVAVQVSSAEIVEISGTVAQDSEYFIPITTIDCPPGSYDLQVSATGTNVTKGIFRIVDEPNGSDIFGEQIIQLKDGSIQRDVTLSDAHRYKYIWVYFMSAGTVNISITPKIYSQQAFIFNSGNTFAKPIYKIYGVSGQVALSVNGGTPFYANITPSGIALDCEDMNAYVSFDKTMLRNRQASGKYENLYIPKGRNIISWTGSPWGIDIDNYSRWI